MVDSFRFETSFLASSLVFIVMGFFSIVFSLALYRKSRAMRIYSENLSANVFDKTFNVFNPHSEHRKTISLSYIELIFLAASLPVFIIFILTIKIIETGLTLGLITFIICLGLLMIDEVSEIYKNANTFVKAVKNGVDFGKGDLEVLFLLKKSSSRLSSYYLSLAVVFFVFSWAVPYIVDPLLLVLSHLVSVLFALNNTLNFVPDATRIFIPLLLFTAVVIMIRLMANKVRSKIFGFSLEPIQSKGEQFERMKQFVSVIVHHPTSRVPEPEEPKKAAEEE